ncbi:uncharacterized protein BJ212DRAFT_1298848 [Suillus subaureus]|uniref:Uncharacterized protein n=1 Tax=Suillus subaureus TaxID=48587 RepID=A0A9P7JEJ3_9AGAM|nr:uncharacterized protein BJ212DRAFT_1298848 [Suillus subaureus]KAG1817975.1 hypothetical protein BJ212DRAFT_1298848 [Suillus subaureus]
MSAFWQMHSVSDLDVFGRPVTPSDYPSSHSPPLAISRLNGTHQVEPLVMIEKFLHERGFLIWDTCIFMSERQHTIPLNTPIQLEAYMGQCLRHGWPLQDHVTLQVVNRAMTLLMGTTNYYERIIVPRGAEPGDAACLLVAIIITPWCSPKFWSLRRTMGMNRSAAIVNEKADSSTRI